MQNSGTSAMVNPSSKQKESFFFQQLNYGNFHTHTHAEKSINFLYIFHQILDYFQRSKNFLIQVKQ